MRVETLEDVLWPGLNLKVRQLKSVDGHLVVDAAGCGPPGRCPQCEHPATRATADIGVRYPSYPSAAGG
ncbi:hypothetical protein GCM10010094_93970 [Streptomyces flaveus]|uniref:Uncharacterized protein n=1 Tax=Streptomyces flaveus TaxID=66370 RepID=A0A917RQQ3_9ACTN|nr:hypothetical protein GCM10010094_93970 [Streptomyces flaveus]